MKVADLYSPTSIRDGNIMTWLSQEYEQVCRNRSSIRERDSVYHLRTKFKNALLNSSPNYLQYKIHKLLATLVDSFYCYNTRYNIFEYLKMHADGH